MGDRMFQAKGTTNTKRKRVGHLRKSKKLIGGRIKCTRDLWKPCQPFLSGGVICVCAQLISPQDMAWPRPWQQLLDPALTCLAKNRWRSPGRPEERGAKGWRRGKAQV